MWFPQESALLIASFLPGRDEMLLILSVLLILFCSNRLPPFLRSRRPRMFGEGVRHFINAAKEVSHETGKSLGSIYGKRGAEALTPNNQTAELYNPAAFRQQKNSHEPRRFQRWLQTLARMCRNLCRRLKGQK
jgi:Sec-independent protein translocase protein TatA